MHGGTETRMTGGQIVSKQMRATRTWVILHTIRIVIHRDIL